MLNESVWVKDAKNRAAIGIQQQLVDGVGIENDVDDAFVDNVDILQERLARVQALGGAFAEIGFSPAMHGAIKNCEKYQEQALV